MNYEAVIGLEVHVHLKTNSKAFCGCSTEFGQKPNSQTCPVCLGFPGSLPVLNQKALEYAIKAGIALNCSIQGYTKFDRKHYYYPDLPKNYQISQYDLPVAKEGFLDIELPDKSKRIRIRRVHLEEDAGKLIHQEAASLVDYNRAGIPLLEIVSEPDIHTPEEAYEYLVALKSVVGYLDVSDCDMEKGSLRCDANISLRKTGETGLGTKAELKNMNSFKAVKDALGFEIERQAGVLDEGKAVIQETRLWDARQAKTFSMRTKEEAHDYRYFPEPDLPPFVIEPSVIEEIRKSIPESAKEKAARFAEAYGLSAYDAGILVLSKKDAEYAEACLKAYQGNEKKAVANWLIGPMLAEANNRNCPLHELQVTPQGLVSLVGFVESQQISNLSAKSVLTEMISSGKAPGDIIKDRNLIQISDTASLEQQADEAIKENPKSVEAFRQGKDNAVMFLVGAVMKKTKGKANPKVVQDIIRRRLNNA